ncbi:MAG: hypothetical protein WCL07_03005 [bacterium]
MNILLAQAKQLGGDIVPQAGGYNADLVTSPAKTVELILTNVITVLTIVGGIMFILYFLFGALQWVSAGGEKGKIEKAKGMLTNAAIGLIIIVLSYSITWIVGKVLGVDILNPAATIMKVIKFK